jgi:hypothetical protein
MANKQFDKYLHPIKLVLSFSEMDDWNAKW